MTRLEDALTQFENAVAGLETSIESMQESAANAKMSNSDSATTSESYENELRAVEDKPDQAVAIIGEFVGSAAQQDRVAETN